MKPAIDDDDNQSRDFQYTLMITYREENVIPVEGGGSGVLNHQSLTMAKTRLPGRQDDVMEDTNLSFVGVSNRLFVFQTIGHHAILRRRHAI